MGITLRLCLASLLPLLSAMSLPPDERLNCAVWNEATGRFIDGDIVQEGTYVFHWKHPSCSLRRQRVHTLCNHSVRLRLYLNGLFPQGVCPSQVHIHTTDDREEQFVGSVDLCRSSSYPETFQFTSQLLNVSLSGSGQAEFLVDFECVSRDTTVKRSVGSDWSGVTSPGYPVSYPNSMDITYSILAPSDEWIVELLADDVTLDDSSDATCSGDFLQIFDGPEHDQSWSQRWCHGGRLLLSSGPLVTLKFHSDASVSGRGFSLHYRAVENVQVRRTREFRAMKQVTLAMLVVFVVMVSVRMCQWKTERRHEMQLRGLVSTLVPHHPTRQPAAGVKDCTVDCTTPSHSTDAPPPCVYLLSDDPDSDVQQKTSGPAVHSLNPLRRGWSGFITYISWALSLVYVVLLVVFLVHCYRALIV